MWRRHLTIATLSLSAAPWMLGSGVTSEASFQSSLCTGTGAQQLVQHSAIPPGNKVLECLK